MWQSHSFDQRSKATKRAVGGSWRWKGVGGGEQGGEQNSKKGGRQIVGLGTLCQLCKS